MPRRPNTRPTTIYFLVDTRPETIAIGWSSGYPFYCGKTVHKTALRLRQHQRDAQKGRRDVHRWVYACEEHIRILPIQNVPPGGDWSAAEKQWITYLRQNFPVCANTNDGGAGMPGYMHTNHAREFTRRLHTGAKRSAETRDRISAAVRARHAAVGHKMSERPRMSESWREYISAKAIVENSNIQPILDKISNGHKLSGWETRQIRNYKAALAKISV